ncbi:hypothetical protein HS088_TW16G00442 [Tripterygium wilfordii]|uniref:Hemerythrin-like domain-containing protein n=1 Tax=Tripterygium wilfordii TaxID=458696 RepID=A0A7J7CJ08_TRIWF|nr:hypothetical protein HS088_TW16G00442 [Tripterygium wilfordii]
MATPLPELQRGDGVMMPTNSAAATKVETKAARLEINGEVAKFPIMLFLFFHKAIRNELDALHRLAMAFATGHHIDIRPLFDRYRLLRSIYKHHSNAEDEVIFPALDIRVKNVAHTYSLEHKGESSLFDHLFELLNAYMQDDENFPRELASCTGALQTTISQHMAKEEEQVFPLLIEKFSPEEQASLIWQFLCSIPVNMMADFLPWLSSSLSSGENQNMKKFLRKIVPDEKLLQQVIFTWMNGRNSINAVRNCADGSEAQYDIDKYSTAGTLTQQTNGVKCACESSRTGKRKYLEPNDEVYGNQGTHPINEILLWHNAIKRELTEIAEEARRIQISGNFTNLSAFDERLQFIAEVCIFHWSYFDMIML